MFFAVGRGTGPETVAPVRVAVSTISLAADSIAEVSYAFRRMRILFWVATAIWKALLWCARCGGGLKSFPGWWGTARPVSGRPARRAVERADHRAGQSAPA